MSWFLFARKAAFCVCLAFATPLAFAQLSYVPQAGQYQVTEPLIGDQVFPQLALSPGRSLMVWEDNRTDASGTGISMLPLDGNFSGVLAPIQVNETAAGNQIRPQVSLLTGGGAGFVWLSGRPELRQVYARFLNANNVFGSGEIAVSANTNKLKNSPVIAGLTGGNAVALWTSYNQFGSNSLQDVYGRVFTPAGQPGGPEFLVNQATKYNQRNPAIAPLASGGFVAVWVSEMQRVEVRDNADPNYEYPVGTAASIDIYARIFNASGGAAEEFLVNTATNVCANPAVAVSSDGGFMIAWSQKDPKNRTNSWDVYARSFSGAGSPATAAQRINTFTYGDQYAPRISAAGTDYLIVWTSLQQDGSREGVFGQFLRGTGVTIGGELLINTDTASQQIHPAVGSDGSRFLVVWSAFTGLANSFDLFGQRFVNTDLPLAPMNPPFVEVPFVVVNGSYQPELRVSWPVQSGMRVDHYEVFVNGSGTPAASVTTNIWVMSGATVSTTYSLQVAFVTTDQRRSPISEATEAKTWSGLNWGGIPFEWMTSYYGNDISTWPPASAKLGGNGPSLLSTFLSGSNPLDPGTWLKTKLVRKTNGVLLTWNPQPGLIYQPQVSTDIKTWVNLGGPRFAADYTDSVTVGGSAQAYYRVLRLR